MILVVIHTNCKLFKSWNKPILSDGKILTNSFCIRNYRKTWNFFSDEANFELKGCVKKQNVRYWSADNPNWQITKSLHSEQVRVWCAISQYCIIEPFFSKIKMDPLYVLIPYGMKKRYWKLFSELKRRRVVLKWTWFQQDGMTSHTTDSVIQCLKQKSSDRLIAHRAVFSWSPQSLT